MNEVVTDLSDLREITNEVYYPLYENRSRYLILYGGAASGKSFFAAMKLIYRILTEQNHRFLVVRKVGRTLNGSTWQLFSDIIQGNPSPVFENLNAIIHKT